MPLGRLLGLCASLCLLYKMGTMDLILPVVRKLNWCCAGATQVFKGCCPPRRGYYSSYGGGRQEASFQLM